MRRTAISGRVFLLLLPRITAETAGDVARGGRGSRLLITSKEKDRRTERIVRSGRQSKQLERETSPI